MNTHTRVFKERYKNICKIFLEDLDSRGQKKYKVT